MRTPEKVAAAKAAPVTRRARKGGKIKCWYCKKYKKVLTENDACRKCNSEYYTGGHYWR